MDILLLTSEFAPAMGGIGTYAGEIAAAAARLGARVTVVAPDYGQDNAGRDRTLPFEVARFAGGLHSMKELPAKMLLARNKVREHPYDVIHAADWPFFIPVALSRWQTRARVLMTVHGTEINETQTPLKRFAIRSAGVFGPRTEIVANSRYTRDLFRERFAVDAGQISAISLGVSDFWFGQRRDRADIRAGLGLAPERLVIVTVARITHRKGYHLTLAALARLPERLRQRITWLVIGPNGEADYVNELQRLIETANCDVRLLGPLPNEEIRDIYGAADLFCLTGLPIPPAGSRDSGWSISRPVPAACRVLRRLSAAFPTLCCPIKAAFLLRPISTAFPRRSPGSPRRTNCVRALPQARWPMHARCPGNVALPRPTDWLGTSGLRRRPRS